MGVEYLQGFIKSVFYSLNTPIFFNAFKGLVIFVFGVLISKLIGKTIKKFAKKWHLHSLILDFLEDFVVVIGVIFSLFMTLQYLGIKIQGVAMSTTAVIGFILSFGFKDLLANVAAGAWISVIEPFKEEDYVTLKGYTGRIKEVNATNIVLEGDNSDTIIIPTKIVWDMPLVRHKLVCNKSENDSKMKGK